MLAYPHLRHLPRFRRLHRTNPAPPMPLDLPSTISGSPSPNYRILLVRLPFPICDASSTRSSRCSLHHTRILFRSGSSNYPACYLAYIGQFLQGLSDFLSDLEQISPPAHSSRPRLYEPFSQLLPAMPVVVNDSSLTPESCHGNTSPSMISSQSQAHGVKTATEAQNKRPRLDLS